MKGFSIMELIVVLGLLGAVVSFSSVGIQKIASSSTLESGCQQTIAIIDHARSLAVGQKEDDDWGVYLGDGELIVYKGTNYNTRDDEFDFRYLLPRNVEVIATDDIVFQKLTGHLDLDITVDVVSKGETMNIVLNRKGVID